MNILPTQHVFARAILLLCRMMRVLSSYIFQSASVSTGISKTVKTSIPFSAGTSGMNWPSYLYLHNIFSAHSPISLRKVVIKYA